MLKTMYGSLEVEELMTISDEDFEVQLSEMKDLSLIKQPYEPSLLAKTYITNYSKILASSITILTITVILYISFNSGKDSMMTLYSATEESSSSSLQFTLNRLNYPPLSMFTDDKRDFLTYNILREHDAVIEPHAPMQLHMYGDSDTAKYSYRFKICPSASTTSSSSSSSSCYTSILKANEQSGTISVPCTAQSSYSITVTELEPSTGSSTSRSAQGSAMCMYVRREIQALSADDLAATMDAMHALWEYDEVKGRAKYGDDFHSSTYFSEAHHFNSAWIESDHIHEGLGFIPQHIKLTNRFEKAMQAVNPAVTMPYWEFTKEVAEGKSVFDSYMFTEKTFGSLYKPQDTRFGFLSSTETVDDGRIQDGRWADLPAETLSLHNMKNAYGLMKAPWSLNPSKYVTRFTADTPSLPTCTNYMKAATYLTGSFIEFLDIMQKDPHASLHQVIGNTYGCDAFSSLIEKGLINEDVTSQVGLCKAWSYYMKDLYRNAYISPQIQSSVAKAMKMELDDDEICADNGSCKYTCDVSRRSEMATFLSQLINKRFVSGYLKSDDWLKFVDFVCGGDAAKMFVGTHMESASSSDPSFWPAHPTQERIMHAKMLSNLIISWIWPTDTNQGYVCDTANCYSDETNTKGFHAICCKGHYEYDTLMDWFQDNKDGSYGETNHDILMASNPVLPTYSMPYIYDEFDWSHCGEEDIMPALEQQYEAVLADPELSEQQQIFTVGVVGHAGGGKKIKEGGRRSRFRS